MKSIKYYVLFVTGYTNLYIYFLVKPFWESYISVLLMVLTPVLGLWTFGVLGKVYNDDEKWLGAIVSFLILVLWFQLIVSIYEKLPYWVT